MSGPITLVNSAGVESKGWRGDLKGVGYVGDGNNMPGLAQTRWVTVVGDTVPTLAGSGCITYINNAYSVKIDSVRITAGNAALLALVVAGTANLVVRAAIDAASDAAALDLLPDAFPSSSLSINAGQIRSFVLTAKVVSAALDANRVVILELPYPVDLEISLDGILRLDFVHDLTGVTLQFGVSAVEAV